MWGDGVLALAGGRQSEAVSEEQGLTNRRRREERSRQVLVSNLALPWSRASWVGDPQGTGAKDPVLLECADVPEARGTRAACQPAALCLGPEQEVGAGLSRSRPVPRAALLSPNFTF